MLEQSWDRVKNIFNIKTVQEYKNRDRCQNNLTNAHELKKRTQNAIIRFIIFFCLCNYIVRCLVHTKILNVQTECDRFLKLANSDCNIITQCRTNVEPVGQTFLTIVITNGVRVVP